MNCRHCRTKLEHVFLDLGFAPPSNAYLTREALEQPELYYPLKLYVCAQCWLVQTQDFASADSLFDKDYAYFSSVSHGWLKHAEDYCRMITQKLKLGPGNMVVEIASNDGYLLKNFVQAGIPCLGIEPTASTAQAAEKLGVPVVQKFFGQRLAQNLEKEGKQADLIIGNNVYAHVPDINDFTFGLKTLLKTNGTVTLEFPHLMRLIEHGQFDTVYHEHFSYLSLTTVCRIFERAGLRVFDVEELATHGGSLRVYGCHADDARPQSAAVAALLQVEEARGLRSLAPYTAFQAVAENIKNDFLAFLLDCKAKGKKTAAFGAAAKGNTLLNFAGVKPDLLGYICDGAPSKQGKFTPGGHIPIMSPAELRERKPDVVIIFPWNIAHEIIEQYSFIEKWGGQFVTAIPALQYF